MVTESKRSGAFEKFDNLKWSAFRMDISRIGKYNQKNESLGLIFSYVQGT